jgi:hypothetical protein
MAVLALINAKTTINAVDMSQFVRSVELDIKHADLETTNYASGGARTRIAGLRDSSVKVTFNDDFAAGGVDALIFALLGTVTPMLVKATSAANSATNPEYQFAVLVNDFPKLGAVGDLASMSVTWPVSGQVIRAVV